MDIVELLTVRSCHQMQEVGVLVNPVFPLPEKAWVSAAMLNVVTPDDREFQAFGEFEKIHINCLDPSLNGWRVILSFPFLSAEQVPPGSTIWVRREIKDALR